MALTETTENDKIEIMSKNGYKIVSVRTASIIYRDGVEISRKFHRSMVPPNADLSLLDEDVATICASVFTQAVKDAYAAHLAAQEV